MKVGSEVHLPNGTNATISAIRDGDTVEPASMVTVMLEDGSTRETTGALLLAPSESGSMSKKEAAKAKAAEVKLAKKTAVETKKRAAAEKKASKKKAAEEKKAAKKKAAAEKKAAKMAKRSSASEGETDDTGEATEDPAQNEEEVGDSVGELSPSSVPLRPGGGLKARGRTLSVAALDDVTYVDILVEEQEEIAAIHPEVSNAFSLNELTRLYADYKLNGKKITAQDFNIVFATFSRTGDVIMADVVYAYLDRQSTGTIPFKVFASFLATMLKGEPEEKMMLCYNLCRPSEDSEGVGREDMITMLMWLPLDKMEKQLQAQHRIAGVLTEDGGAANEPFLEVMEEEDEDDEDAELKAEQRAAAEMESPESKLDGGRRYTNLNGPETETMKRRQRTEPDPANRKKAIEIVDKAYMELGKAVKDRLSFEDWQVMCTIGGVAEFFVPF